MTHPRQIHLAAHFPGVNNTTVWSDPAAGSHIDFSSFEQLARTAERAKFDFFFLAEGQRMREHFGPSDTSSTWPGDPDNLTRSSPHVAAVTDRIGLMPTITTTYHEPHELARQLGTLDHLSGGRAGLEPRHLDPTPSPGRTSAAAATCPTTSAMSAASSSSSRFSCCGMRGRATGRDSPTTVVRSGSPANSRCRRCRRGAR